MRIIVLQFVGRVEKAATHGRFNVPCGFVNRSRVLSERNIYHCLGSVRLGIRKQGTPTVGVRHRMFAESDRLFTQLRASLSPSTSQL